MVDKDFALDKRLMAITGDHQPIINPPLKTSPEPVFLIAVGNLSERKAGIDPKAVADTISLVQNNECISYVRTTD